MLSIESDGICQLMSKQFWYGEVELCGSLKLKQEDYGSSLEDRFSWE